MKRHVAVLASAGVLGAAIVVRAGVATPPLPQQKAASSSLSTAQVNETIETYCVDCHNDQFKRGNRTFEKFDLAGAHANLDTLEAMIRKLQAGMMPPPGEDRPDGPGVLALINTLEARADAIAAAKPNPGSRVFPRLNRTEYRNSVRDLIDLDVDAGLWLPLDQKSANFDNLADEQTISATLLESSLNAASEISRLAVGDRHAPRVDRT